MNYEIIVEVKLLIGGHTYTRNDIVDITIYTDEGELVTARGEILEISEKYSEIELRLDDGEYETYDIDNIKKIEKV